MYLLYEKLEEGVRVVERISRHIPPHLHDAIEFVYVSEGALEFGVGEELYHLEKGDLAMVFPNVIHHCQVFSKGENRAVHIMAEPSLFGMFSNKLQKYCPMSPKINKINLHVDVINAIEHLWKNNDDNLLLKQSYLQLILAHVFSQVQLVDKENIGSNDIVYKSVAYIAANFRECISLEGMAFDLGVSKYVLSRVFSGTFHMNFSRYVNEIRLNYACSYLENTDKPITEICLDCGFESQATFNRVFKNRYRKSPREYRNDFRISKGIGKSIEWA